MGSLLTRRTAVMPLLLSLPVALWMLGGQALWAAGLLAGPAAQSQEEIWLRWNDGDVGCLHAFFLNGDCHDERGGPGGIPHSVGWGRGPEGCDRAVRTTGSSSVIDFGYGLQLADLDAWTIACWVRPGGTAQAARRCILHKGPLIIALTPLSTDRFGITVEMGRSGRPASAATGPLLIAGGWKPIAVVWDRAAPIPLRVFVDGVDASLPSRQPGAGDVPPDEADPLLLLNHRDGGQALGGELDSLMLWNRALARQELKRLARNGLVSLWPLDGDVRDEWGVHNGAPIKLEYVEGRTGKAASFLEPGSAIRCGQTLFAQTLDRLAARARIRIPARPATAEGIVIGKMITPSNGWALRVQYRTDGVRLYGVVGAEETNALSVSKETFPYGSWQDVAFSYDGLGDRAVHLWIGGSEVVYERQTPAQGARLSDYVSELVIGNTSALDRPLFGFVDQLALYSRPLDADDFGGGELLVAPRGYRPVVGASTGTWDLRTQRDPTLLMDESGAVVQDENGYTLYYSGFGTVNDFTRHWSIGRATSPDGVHWTPGPGSEPVLRRDSFPLWDNYDVRMGTVIKMSDGTYRLYYAGMDSAQDWGLGLALSDDGIHFERDPANPVALGRWWNSGNYMVAVPFVVKLSTGQWVLLFEASWPFRCYLGLSDDGIQWAPANRGNPVLSRGSAGQWDGNGVANPKLFELGPGQYLLGYNGQSENSNYSLGFAHSSDLIRWVKFEGNPVMAPGPADWDLGRIENAFVAKQDVGTPLLRMWYFGAPDTGGQFCRIGYATCPQISDDIFGMVDVTGWEKYREPEIDAGGSLQVAETAGAPATCYTTIPLPPGPHSVVFLAHRRGEPLTPGDIEPFASDGAENQVVRARCDLLTDGTYLCYGSFTATEGAWKVGFRARAHASIDVAQPACYAWGELQRLRLERVEIGPGHAVKLLWFGLPGFEYRLTRSSILPAAPEQWLEIGPGFSGEGQPIEWIDETTLIPPAPGAMAPQMRFYRLESVWGGAR